jgi:peptidoglycan/LPS O-acetylase OafA/YrhL
VSSVPAPSPTHKLAGLEALRFIAAFAVVIWHYQHFAYVANKPIGLVRAQLPFYGALQPFYEHGLYGVQIFWCISGFIFFWKHRDAISNHAIRPTKFVMLRLSRLYPLHLATLLLVAFLQQMYLRSQGVFFVFPQNDLFHFGLNLFLANHWGFQTDDSFNGPTWSISVEVLAYFIFFALLSQFGRSLAIHALFIMLAFVLPSQLFLCLAFFYAGGLAAIARKNFSGAKAPRVIELVAWLALIGMVMTVLLLHLEFREFDLVLLLIGTPLLLFCISKDYALPMACQRIIEAAGNMTYSSYLLHFPIQLSLALYFSILGKPIPYRDASFFVLFIAATASAAYLGYVLFEAPAQKLIRSNFKTARL